jgi:hypothetical protein
MRRRRWYLRFALDHALGQPLKPFPDGVAVQCAPVICDENTEFAPRDHDRPAEEVIDELQRDLATKYEDA